MTSQNFFSGQAVQGKGNRNHRIDDGSGNAADHIHRTAHHQGDLFPQERQGIGQQILQIQAVQLQCLLKPRPQIRIICQDLRQLCSRPVDKRGNPGGQRINRQLNLGNQQLKYHHNHQNQAENGEHNRHSPAKALLPDVRKLPFNGPHRHIKNKRKASANHKWRDQLPDGVKHHAGPFGIQNQPCKQDAAGNQEKYSVHKLFVKIQSHHLYGLSISDFRKKL